MRAVVMTVIAAAAVVVVPGVASAKQIEQVLVCGAGGCRDVTDRAPGDESMMQGGVLDDGPRHGAPFYRVRFSVGNGGDAHARWAVLYVPSREMLRTKDDSTGRVDWLRLSDSQRRAYRRAVRGMRPLPASRMPVARMGESEVRGALPPEVVGPPAVPARSDSGGWGPLPLLGVSLGMVCALGATGRWLARRRPHD